MPVWLHTMEVREMPWNGKTWPGMIRIKQNMDAISDLPLPAAGVANILGGNAAKLLGL